MVAHYFLTEHWVNLWDLTGDHLQTALLWTILNNFPAATETYDTPTYLPVPNI